MENTTQLPQDAESQQAEVAKRAQEEQMRRDLMATVLDTAARERCTFCRILYESTHPIQYRGRKAG